MCLGFLVPGKTRIRTCVFRRAGKVEVRYSTVRFGNKGNKGNKGNTVNE